MREMVKNISARLNWKLVVLAMVTLSFMGLFFYDRLPGLFTAVSITQLLLILVCLLPCLAPVALLRRKEKSEK